MSHRKPLTALALQRRLEQVEQTKPLHQGEEWLNQWPLVDQGEEWLDQGPLVDLLHQGEEQPLVDLEVGIEREEKLEVAELAGEENT